MLIRDVMQQGAPQEQPTGTAPAQAPPDPVNQEAMAPQDPTAVSPEEQEAFERVVLAGIEAISNPEANKGIMQMLKQGADEPAKTLSDVAALIVLQLDEQSGGQLPEVVIIPAAAEIMENVAEFAHESGTFVVDEALLNQAGQHLILRLVEEYGVDPEDVQALIDSVDPETQQQMVAQQQQYGPPASDGGV